MDETTNIPDAGVRKRKLDYPLIIAGIVGIVFPVMIMALVPARALAFPRLFRAAALLPTARRLRLSVLEIGP